MRFIFLAILLATVFHNGYAQNLDSLLDAAGGGGGFVQSTFKTTRIINAHSIETMAQRSLDFRVTHRFDDVAGSAGGPQTFFGLDNVTDVRIAFEYGITDRLAAAVGRSKGSGEIRSVLDGYLKYRLLRQSDDKRIPVSITLLGVSGFTYMERSGDTASVAFLPKFKHRFAYTSQVMIARKFSERFSFQVMGAWVHRNYVPFGDENGFPAVGGGGRFKFSKRFGVIADYYHLFSEFRRSSEFFFNPLSVGLEIETGGHVFHVNFTNSRGIIENDYLTTTKSDWLQGQFSFGFNISRVFFL